MEELENTLTGILRDEGCHFNVATVARLAAFIRTTCEPFHRTPKAQSAGAPRSVVIREETSAPDMPKLAEVLEVLKPLVNIAEALKPLVNIANAYDANELDGEARKFWGKSEEFENQRTPEQIELYSSRARKRLLTLADCLVARALFGDKP